MNACIAAAMGVGRGTTRADQKERDGAQANSHGWSLAGIRQDDDGLEGLAPDKLKTPVPFMPGQSAESGFGPDKASFMISCAHSTILLPHAR